MAQDAAIGVTHMGTADGDMAMDQPHRRALIVEDEALIALGLEADMHALGFHICDLVANGQEALSHAMSTPMLL
jgi:CheY-like chemotaxis protein